MKPKVSPSEDKTERDGNNPGALFRRGLPVGIAVGVAVGVALGNIAVGIAVGMGLSVAFGMALRREKGEDSAGEPE